MENAALYSTQCILSTHNMMLDDEEDDGEMNL